MTVDSSATPITVVVALAAGNMHPPLGGPAPKTAGRDVNDLYSFLFFDGTDGDLSLLFDV